MVTKEYKLAAGLNVGMQNAGSQEDNIKGLIYSNNILDFFHKNIQNHFDFLRMKFPNEFNAATSSPKYHSFMMQYNDEDGYYIPFTPDMRKEQLDYILGIMGDKYQKELDGYIKRLKSRWQESAKFMIESMKKAESGNCENKPIEIKDGKGVLKGDFLVHNIRFNKNIEDYESRKDLGIIASEWFGKEEDRHEGFMCSFFTKTDEIKESKDSFMEEDDIGFPIPAEHPNFSFILDASNPDLRKLMENDYFEYEREKNNPEFIKNLSEEQIELFENIEACSPKGHDAATTNTDWVAIPGGVPSKFIVGIIAGNLSPDSPDLPMVKEIAEVFNVPMFNSALEVVYIPEKNLSKEKPSDAQELETKESLNEMEQ